MILLPEQFQMCFLHLIMGWLFGFSFSFESAFNQKIFKKHFGHFLEFVFMTFFVLIFYSSLYTLNGGVSHFYGFCLFLLGIYIYFKLYFMTFNPFITGFVNCFHSLLHAGKVAFLRLIGIIDIRSKFKKWRNRIANKKRKEKRTKKKTKKTSSDVH